MSNGNTPTVLDDATKPPAGVVLPPKDIRAIVEKTAGYVARNGAVFEGICSFSAVNAYLRSRD
jgi:splicing factor 3A subunit 1